MAEDSTFDFHDETSLEHQLTSIFEHLVTRLSDVIASCLYDPTGAPQTPCQRTLLTAKIVPKSTLPCLTVRDRGVSSPTRQ